MKEVIVIILIFLITTLLHGLFYLMRPLKDGSTESLSLYYPSLAISIMVIILCLYLTARQYPLHHFPDTLELARVKTKIITDGVINCKQDFDMAEQLQKEQQMAKDDKKD